jgi:hypothetical protein
MVVHARYDTLYTVVFCLILNAFRWAAVEVHGGDESEGCANYQTPPGVDSPLHVMGGLRVRPPKYPRFGNCGSRRCRVVLTAACRRISDNPLRGRFGETPIITCEIFSPKPRFLTEVTRFCPGPSGGRFLPAVIPKNHQKIV